MGSAARLPTARPCPPATVLDFRARLARGRARAAREGKCWRFYPPADPLQAALRLAPLIIPMIDFIQSARRYSKRLQLTPRASPSPPLIPARPGDRKLIVGQDVGPLLRLGPARGDHDRDLGDAELSGGQHASMARDQTTV